MALQAPSKEREGKREFKDKKHFATAPQVQATFGCVTQRQQRNTISRRVRLAAYQKGKNAPCSTGRDTRRKEGRAGGENRRPSPEARCLIRPLHRVDCIMDRAQILPCRRRSPPLNQSEHATMFAKPRAAREKPRPPDSSHSPWRLPIRAATVVSPGRLCTRGEPVPDWNFRIVFAQANRRRRRRCARGLHSGGRLFVSSSSLGQTHRLGRL